MNLLYLPGHHQHGSVTMQHAIMLENPGARACESAASTLLMHDISCSVLLYVQASPKASPRPGTVRPSSHPILP